MAVRENTYKKLFNKVSSAAVSAMGELPVNRRSHKKKPARASAPKNALGTRQPHGLSPNSLIPAAMNSLPSGGASGLGFAACARSARDALMYCSSSKL